MNRKILLQSRIWIFLLVAILVLSACGGTEPEVEDPQVAELATSNLGTLVTETEAITENLSASIAPTVTPTVAATSTPGPLSVDDVYQRLKNSTIYVYANTLHGMSTGTGIIYTADGYAVTNAHVIDKATSIRVYREGSETSLAAKVLGISYCDDLAVLDIEGDGFEPASFGDSDALKRGEEVVAIGYPLSAELGMDLVVVSGQVNRLNAQVENLESAIQTDAPINPGNSGGPLANLYGEVIGINTTRINATSGGQRVTGVGFAITSNFATAVLSQLESGRSLYYTGLDFQLDKRETNWLPIIGVDAQSPAKNIGIIPGDVLISINQQGFRTYYDLCRMMKESGYEEQGVTFDFMRGQTKLSGEMGKRTLSLSAPSASVQTVVRLAELSETEITKLLKDDFRVIDIGYDGTSWIVLLAQDSGFSDQKIRTIENHSDLDELLNTLKGHYITDLAYGEGNWIAVLSKGTGFTEQQIVSGRLFPEDAVDERRQNGYAITSVASGGERWIVVMSSGSGYTEQQYEFVDHDDLSGKLSELASNRQHVTLLASSNRWVGDSWFVAYSEVKTYGKQKHLITRVVSDDVIDTVMGRNASPIDAIQALKNEWIILYR